MMMRARTLSFPRIIGAVMRRLIVVIALLASVAEVSAGEFEFPEPLRGSSPYVPAPPVYTRWSGFYAGGELGYGTAHIDFSNATRQLYTFMLRELALENEQHVSQWQVLGAKDTGGHSIGGFAGFNAQFDDVIMGFDVHYSSTAFSASAAGTPLSRRTSAGGNVYDVTINGTADMNIHDWGAARGRVGYVWNNILPYGTFGLAFGRADISRTGLITGEENPPAPTVPPTPCGPPTTCVPFTYTASEARKNVWIWGWAAGLGADFLILPNLFLRAELEFVSFAGVMGTKANISTARVGAAIKF
jgi:outer membrane immunogenic protein